MSRSSAPRVQQLLFLLAAVAQVGALMPLLLLSRRLMPVGLATSTFSLGLPGVGPSPVVLLVVWLGGWYVANRAPQWKGFLIPLILAGGLLLAWLGLPHWGRSSSPFDLIFLLSLLPPIVAAWWCGGRFGALGVTWASTYDGLRFSVGLCLLGLLSLQPFPPVGREVALLGPLLLFTAGLPLLYLVRPREEEINLKTTIAAVLPVLAVAGGFWLIKSASANPVIQFIWRYGGAGLEWVMVQLTPLVEPIYNLIHGQMKPLTGDPPREKGDWGDVPYTDGTLANLQSDPAPYLIAVILIAVVLLLGLLIWRSAVKRRRSVELELDEVRTGPGLLGGLLEELRALLTKEPAPPEEELPAGHPRQLLRRLQGWGARSGRARRSGETPGQYAVALRPLLPSSVSAEGLGALTSAYEECRYASGSPDPAQLQSAQALLHDLERPGA